MIVALPTSIKQPVYIYLYKCVSSTVNTNSIHLLYGINSFIINNSSKYHWNLTLQFGLCSIILLGFSYWFLSAMVLAMAFISASCWPFPVVLPFIKPQTSSRFFEPDNTTQKWKQQQDTAQILKTKNIRWTFSYQTSFRTKQYNK